MAGRVLTINIEVTGGADTKIQALVKALNDLTVAQLNSASGMRESAQAADAYGKGLRSAVGAAGTLKKALDTSVAAQKQNAEAIAAASGKTVAAINNAATATSNATGKMVAGNKSVQMSFQATASSVQQAATSFSTATSSVSVNMNTISGGVQRMSIATKQGFNQITQGAQTFAVSFQNVAQKVQSGGANIAANVKNIVGNMASLGGSIKGAIAQFFGLSNAAGKAAIALNAAGQATVTVKNSIDDARRSAYALTIAGAQTRVIFGQIEGALSGVIEKLAEFDFNLRRAAGAAGIFDETSEQFKALEKSARDLAVTTKMFSSADIAKGMYYWSSTTGEAVDATNQLIPVMKLAAMTETGLESSIKGVVNILQQFGEPMTSTNRVVEELFQVTQKTALEFPNLIESFKMVGPVAAGFGVSIEEMMKLFGILGDVGVKGSMAGRAMAMMFAQIADPTDKATAALNKYAQAAGMIAATGNFWDLVWPEGKFIGVQGFLNLLTEMTKNLNEENKQALLAAITTQNEWRALAPLVDANTRSIIESGKGIVETTDAMDGAAKSFKSQSELVLNSVRATFSEIQVRIDNISNTFGRALMEVLDPLLKKVNELLDAFQKWADANPELMKMAATLAVVAAGFFAVATAVLLITGYFKLLASVALPTLGIMTGALDKTASATAITHIGLRSLVGTITNFITKIPQIAAVAAIFATVAGVITGIVQGAGPALGRLFTKIAEVLGKLAGATVMVLTGLFKFGESVGQRVAPAVSQLADVLVIVIDSLDAFMGWLGEILSTLAADTNIQAFVDQMGQLVEILGSAVWSTLSAFIEGLAWMAKTAAFWVGKLAEALNIGGGPKGGGPDSYGPNELLVDTNDAAARKKLEYSGPTQYPGGAMAMGIPLPVSTGNEVQDLLAIRDAWDQYTAAVENNNKVTIQRHALSERTDAINAAETASVEATTTAVSAAFTKFNAMVTDALKNLSSGNREAAVAAYNTVRTYAATMIERAPNEIPPAVKALFTAAQSAVKSNTAAGRVTGKQITAIIAEGFRSGHTELILPRVAEMLKGIRDKIKSNNPAMQKEGRDSLVALAQGLSTSGLVDTAAQNQLGNAINALQSANPDMWQSGYDWIMEVVNGVGGGYPALVKAMQAVARTARRYGENISEFVKNPLGEGNKPPVDTFKPEPLDTGGGGGGGTEQSPLEKALEVAKNAADLAEALAKIKGLNIKKLVQEAMGPIAEAMVLAERITYRYAKGFSKEHLQKVADFSDAMSKMVGFINGAFDAFTKAKDFKAVSSTVLNKLFDAVQYSVVQMEKIAKKLTGTKGRDSLLAQTAIFAESANAVVSSIGSAFEAFAKVPKDFTAPPKELLDEVSKAIGDAVTAMEKVAKDTDTTLLTAAKDFSDAAKSVMDAIGAGLDLFSKKFDVKIPTPDDMRKVVAAIRLAVDTLLVEVTAFNAQYGMAGEYGDNGKMKALQVFADVAKSIMDAIQTAFNVFQPQEFKEAIPGQTRNPLAMVGELVDDMVNVIQTVNDKFASINLTMTIDDIKALIDVAKGVIDAIQSFFALAGQATQQTEGMTIQELIATKLNEVMRVVSAFIDSFYENGADLVKNFASGLQDNEALKQLDNALHQLQQRITNALSGIGTLTITWSSGGGVSAASGGGVSAAGGVSAVGAAGSVNGVQNAADQKPPPGTVYWTNPDGTMGSNWAPTGPGPTIIEPGPTIAGADWNSFANSYSPPPPASQSVTTPSNTVNVNVNVTSSDGSVDNLSQKSLSKLIAEQLRSNLQHSASVK